MLPRKGPRRQGGFEDLLASFLVCPSFSVWCFLSLHPKKLAVSTPGQRYRCLENHDDNQAETASLPDAPHNPGVDFLSHDNQAWLDSLHFFLLFFCFYMIFTPTYLT